jgi:dodecin
MGGIYKKIEIVGTSTESLEDAIRTAVQAAAKSVRRLSWFEVVEQRGAIKDGKVAEFQVTLRVGFKLDS